MASSRDQNARVGQDRARDGNALALAAGKLHAALAHDGVVLLFEAFGEFVDARDAAGFQDLLFGGMRPGERDVLPNGPVEQKRFLQHHAELRAVGVQADGGEIHAVHQDGSRFRCVKRSDQADDGRLAGAGRAHQRGHRARLGAERNVVQHGFSGCHRRSST